MTQSGPRDLASVLDSRYRLTPEGEAALALSRRIEVAAKAGHAITVTGPSDSLVRSFFECTCGIERRFASRHAANVTARLHLDYVTREIP